MDAVLRVVFGCLGGLLFLVVGAGMMWLMVDYCKNPKETIWTRVCLAPFGFAVAIGALLVSAKAFAQAFGSDIDLAWLIFWVKTSS